MKRKVCFIINLGHNMLVNILLFVLLVLSLWVIFSIGINWLPLFNSSFCDKTIRELNNVWLNLSYSYLAGIIIYCLTVIIPNFNQRSKYTPLINSQISEYCSNALFVFLMFYYNKTDIVDIKQNENIKDFYENELKLQHKLIDGIASKEDKDSQSERLQNLKQEYICFINNIIPYERYLSEDQNEIIIAIRTQAFTKYIELYIESVGVSDIDKIYYDEFNNYIKLVVKLRETIQTVPKSTA